MYMNRGGNYGMSSESYRTYHTLHAAAAIILAASLVLLPWIFDIGPNTWRACAPEAPAKQVAAAAPVVIPPATNVEIPAPPPAQVPLPQTPAPVARVQASAEPEVPVAASATDEQSSDLPTARIYFDVNKSDLPATGASAIAPIVDYLSANTSAKVWVSGFHDGNGSLASNEKVAHNRALSVSKELQNAGIASSRIILVKPQQTASETPPEEARRVELSIQP